jgi:2-iminoacetate synthase ThiH
MGQRASTRPRRCGSTTSAARGTRRAGGPAAPARPRPGYDGRGNEIVTYIVDRNINYTNVCNVYCKFCAFYRTEKDDDAYVITLDEMDRKIEETIALGGTQILLQGGHHPKLTKQWYLDLLAHMKGKFPQVNIHGFSPSEFVHFREVFHEPLEKIIGDFKAAGWARFRAAAARSWWTACGSASRRSRR